MCLMASVRKEILLDADADEVWSAVRDFGAVARRLTPGVTVESVLDGDERVVRFASGAEVREVLVDIDDDRRRLVYGMVDSPLPLVHYNAAMQVHVETGGRSRLVWLIDVFPHELAEAVGAIADQGTAAMLRVFAR